MRELISLGKVHYQAGLARSLHEVISDMAIEEDTPPVLANLLALARDLNADMHTALTAVMDANPPPQETQKHG